MDGGGRLRRNTAQVAATVVLLQSQRDQRPTRGEIGLGVDALEEGLVVDTVGTAILVRVLPLIIVVRLNGALVVANVLVILGDGRRARGDGGGQVLGRKGGRLLLCRQLAGAGGSEGTLERVVLFRGTPNLERLGLVHHGWGQCSLSLDALSVVAIRLFGGSTQREGGSLLRLDLLGGWGRLGGGNLARGRLGGSKGWDVGVLGR